MRVWVVAAAVAAVVAGGLAVAAAVAWPHVRLGPSDDALARVQLRGFAGDVTAVAAGSTAGAQVPVELRGGEVWPLRKLSAGERLTVEVTVRRPGWAAWLVGNTEQRSFTIETPTRAPARALLQVKDGGAVTVAFDQRRSASCRSAAAPRTARSRPRRASCRSA